MAKNPKDLEDLVLAYLKNQEMYPEDSDLDFLDLTKMIPEKDSKTELLVKDIIEGMLDRVEKQLGAKEIYKKMKSVHHQFPLFELKDLVPDFHMTDELMQKLSFKETLLISNIDQTTVYGEAVCPQPVGGLCLDIQLVKGGQPIVRSSDDDFKFEMGLIKMGERIKEEMLMKPLVKEERTEEIRKKLEEYQQELKDSMNSGSFKFLVHLSSQFHDRENAGSSISAWVDKEFHTLEERRREFIRDSSNIHEKYLYFALLPLKYYRHVSCNKTGISSKKYIPLSRVKDLVGEGANFLLMRYLAISRFIGSFELSTFYINGDLCRNIYECKGIEAGIVNDSKIDICKIHRTIIEECGLEHRSITVLSLDGRIITQEWDGCNCILNVNPLQVMKNERDDYVRNYLSKSWKSDLQLVSQYLDHKSKAEAEISSYIDDHKEIKDLVADFLQQILLLKPENVVEFSVDYFKNFAPLDVGTLEYFSDSVEKDDFHF